MSTEHLEYPETEKLKEMHHVLFRGNYKANQLGKIEFIINLSKEKIGSE
jgi:hypothetical protein